MQSAGGQGEDRLPQLLGGDVLLTWAAPLAWGLLTPELGAGAQGTLGGLMEEGPEPGVDVKDSGSFRLCVGSLAWWLVYDRGRHSLETGNPRVPLAAPGRHWRLFENSLQKVVNLLFGGLGPAGPRLGLPLCRFLCPL